MKEYSKNRRISSFISPNTTKVLKYLRLFKSKNKLIISYVNLQAKKYIMFSVNSSY